MGSCLSSAYVCTSSNVFWPILFFAGNIDSQKEKVITFVMFFGDMDISPELVLADNKIIQKSPHNWYISVVLEHYCFCFMSVPRRDYWCWWLPKHKIPGPEAKEYVHKEIGLNNSTGHNNSHHGRLSPKNQNLIFYESKILAYRR